MSVCAFTLYAHQNHPNYIPYLIEPEQYHWAPLEFSPIIVGLDRPPTIQIEFKQKIKIWLIFHLGSSVKIQILNTFSGDFPNYNVDRHHLHLVIVWRLLDFQFPSVEGFVPVFLVYFLRLAATQLMNRFFSHIYWMEFNAKRIYYKHFHLNLVCCVIWQSVDSKIYYLTQCDEMECLHWNFLCEMFWIFIDFTFILGLCANTFESGKFTRPWLFLQTADTVAKMLGLLAITTMGERKKTDQINKMNHECNEFKSRILRIFLPNLQYLVIETNGLTCLNSSPKTNPRWLNE